MKPAGHRLQFNIDSNVWMYKYRKQSAFYRPSEEPLTASVIHRYVDILADSGIDTLTVNAHSTQLAYYPSKTLPTILDGYTRGDRSFVIGHIKDQVMTDEQVDVWVADHLHLLDGYLDLVEAGVDWVAETAAACRRRGICPWVSLRMNDVHGATKYPELSFMNCELYKDPSMRLADRPYNLPGFNFEKAEVREYVSRVVRDLVENYDYDGFQMEWNRTPLCCEPDASQATADMMTDWHAEVRAVTKAKATGKEYTLGMKYVGSWDQLKSIGLDVRAMVDRGLLDFVAPSNFWQSSWDIACDELREAVGPDVAVHGSIEFSPNYLHGYFPGQKQGNTSLGKELPVCYRLTPLCPPLLRGNAAAKLVLGVDGLEIYNYPCADSPSHWPWSDEPGCADYSALRGLDDLEELRGQEKAYTLSTQTGYYIVPPWDTVAHFPGVLGPGEARLCRLPMCAEPEDGDLEFVIQVVVGKTEDAGVVAIMLNGSWPRVDGVLDDRLLFAVSTMTHHTPDHVGVDFVFPVSVIREGWNEIVVMNGTAKDHWAEQAGAEVSVASLECAVRRKG